MYIKPQKGKKKNPNNKRNPKKGKTKQELSYFLISSYTVNL